MEQELVRFRIANLGAQVAEGVDIVWQAKEYNSGPLVIRLNENVPSTANQGELDYSRRRARAEFHVRVEFPEFSNMLETLGVDPELTQPLCTVLHSEGEILEDHSFLLSGRCDLSSHALLSSDETRASVLPGH
jgi:hypothetical protein